MNDLLGTNAVIALPRQKRAVDLARKGTPIGPYDTLIAGQAKARRLCLVTNNTREFRRVEGLVEDWTL